MAPETTVDDVDAFEQRELVVSIELSIPGDCPLSELVDGDISSINANVVDGGCLCEASVEHEDGTEHVHESHDLDSSCVCSAFCESDHIPHIQSLHSDSMIVRTRVLDRTKLKALVSRLQSIVDVVRVIQISREPAGGGQEPDTVFFDISSLTKKQRETLDHAVSRGYYDDPKGVTIDELASDLGISPSTVSYHLKAAETKLVNSLIENL